MLAGGLYEHHCSSNPCPTLCSSHWMLTDSPVPLSLWAAPQMEAEGVKGPSSQGLKLKGLRQGENKALRINHLGPDIWSICV